MLLFSPVFLKLEIHWRKQNKKTIADVWVPPPKDPDLIGFG